MVLPTMPTPGTEQTSDSLTTALETSRPIYIGYMYGTVGRVAGLVERGAERDLSLSTFQLDTRVTFHTLLPLIYSTTPVTVFMRIMRLLWSIYTVP